jgi:hypothetical protein
MTYTNTTQMKSAINDLQIEVYKNYRIVDGNLSIILKKLDAELHSGNLDSKSADMINSDLKKIIEIRNILMDLLLMDLYNKQELKTETKNLS